MIIDQMTLRMKNIIFFKAVCICIAYTFISYTISALLDKVEDFQIKNAKAIARNIGAEERLNALSSQNKKLQDTIVLYENLKHNASNNLPDDCANNIIYENNIKNVEKNFGLKDPANIFISSNAVVKKDQPKQTILLKVTTVKVQYYVNDFLSAVKFAKEVFTTLPAFSFVSKFEIIKHDSLTPNLAKWLESAHELDLISACLEVKVREIGLNDNNQ